MIQSVALVGIGGAIGSILRYLAGCWLKPYTTGGFPWSTFGVNIIGSLLIGILIAYFQTKTPAQNSLQLLLVTGFCGGFTTFSSFTLENIQLIQEGKIAVASTYIVLSIIFGLLAVALGIAVTRWLLTLT
jgi:CrcB protein